MYVYLAAPDGAPALHAEACQAARQQLLRRVHIVTRVGFVQELQLHQVGVPVEGTEVGKHGDVVAGGLEGEAAQRGDPACAATVVMPSQHLPQLADKVTWQIDMTGSDPGEQSILGSTRVKVL